MNYTAEPLAIFIFCAFVVAVLAISYFFSRKAKSSSGYYAAGGKTMGSEWYCLCR